MTTAGDDAKKILDDWMAQTLEIRAVSEEQMLFEFLQSVPVKRWGDVQIVRYPMHSQRPSHAELRNPPKWWQVREKRRRRAQRHSVMLQVSKGRPLANWATDHGY